MRPYRTQYQNRPAKGCAFRNTDSGPRRRLRRLFDAVACLLAIALPELLKKVALDAPGVALTSPACEALRSGDLVDSTLNLFLQFVTAIDQEAL